MSKEVRYYWNKRDDRLDQCYNAQHTDFDHGGRIFTTQQVKEALKI